MDFTVLPAINAVLNATSAVLVVTGLVQPIRTVYFVILVSHSVLAVVTVPLVIVTGVRTLKNRLEAHKKIAKWTVPIWVYVSVTCVVVYLMLYPLD
jgi:putative membrane protein